MFFFQVINIVGDSPGDVLFLCSTAKVWFLFLIFLIHVDVYLSKDLYSKCKLWWIKESCSYYNYNQLNLLLLKISIYWLIQLLKHHGLRNWGEFRFHSIPTRRAWVGKYCTLKLWNLSTYMFLMAPEVCKQPTGSSALLLFSTLYPDALLRGCCYTLSINLPVHLLKQYIL